MSRILIQEILKLAAAARMPQLPESLRLNLTDTLTCNTKVLSNLFECTSPPIIKPKTQPEDFLFTRGQCIEYFLQLFFGWEAVGLVSYLLIGFWYTRPTAIFANMKAFLVNRVGDFGFVLGIGLIYAFAGSLDYKEVFAQREALAAAMFPGTSWMLITTICICLFIGAMGKSAQVPLHVWLPDSMEGPTPISALIHAATMVTAGIFMVSRMSPLFELSDTALSFVLIIGSITALFMGFLGIIQNDIKRVVAYSTLSQLGYMTVALGVSAYPIAIFHLMTHAFFKALLFLGAGSVIIGMHHGFDLVCRYTSQTSFLQ